MEPALLAFITASNTHQHTLLSHTRVTQLTTECFSAHKTKWIHVIVPFMGVDLQSLSGQTEICSKGNLNQSVDGDSGISVYILFLFFIIYCTGYIHKIWTLQ